MDPTPPRSLATLPAELKGRIVALTHEQDENFKLKYGGHRSSYPAATDAFDLVEKAAGVGALAARP